MMKIQMKYLMSLFNVHKVWPSYAVFTYFKIYRLSYKFKYTDIKMNLGIFFHHLTQSLILIYIILNLWLFFDLPIQSFILI